MAMIEIPLDELKAAYYRYLDTISAYDLWAYEYVDNLVSEDPVKSWKLLLELVRDAPTTENVENIGAGHLEEFLKTHLVQYIDKIRTEARTNERLVSALRISFMDESYPGYDLYKELKQEVGPLD
jgi:hypothetical protein